MHIESELFLCIRCGREQESHDPNLVNESAVDFPWIEEVAEDCEMNILECMETKYPAEYANLLQDTVFIGWPGRNRFGVGYVSRDAMEEARLYFKDRYMPSHDIFLTLPGGRTVNIGS